MKKTLPFIFLSLLLVALPISAYSQISTGLILDDEEYESLPILRFFNNANTVLPKRVSHRAYTPYPKNQGEIGSCTGYAAGYAAMTTLTAIKHGYTDRKFITDNAYSALYPFHMNLSEARRAGSCKLGTSLTKMLVKLKKRGNKIFEKYDAPDPTKCPSIVSSTENQLVKISSFQKLINNKRFDSKEQKIAALRQEIAAKGVAIVGVEIAESIRSLKNSGIRKWKPESYDTGIYHAMCIIGYDDEKREFELMNSWGPNFGDDGYFFMDYDDLVDRLQYAFRISIAHDFLAANEEVPRTIEEEDSKALVVDASISKWEYDNNYDSLGLQVRYNEGGYYTAKGKRQDAFRIYLKPTHEERNVIVVSFNTAKDQIYFNWPSLESLDNLISGADIVNSLSTIVYDVDWAIPSKNSYMQIKDGGTEYFFVLYGTKVLNVHDYLDEFSRINDSANKIETFYEVFDKYLIDKSAISYNRSNLQARTNNYTKGYILPVILQFQK